MKTTIYTIAKGKGERAKQAREIIRLNKEADREIDKDFLSRPTNKKGQSIATKLYKI